MTGTPGRVFSGAELINRLRGYEFDGYERTVDDGPIGCGLGGDGDVAAWWGERDGVGDEVDDDLLQPVAVCVGRRGVAADVDSDVALLGERTDQIDGGASDVCEVDGLGLES